MVERSPFVVLEFRRWSSPVSLLHKTPQAAILAMFGATHKTVQSMQHRLREHIKDYVLTCQEGVSFNDSSVEYVEVEEEE
eukprot:1917824-Amphidinium_carterae.2